MKIFELFGEVILKDKASAGIKQISDNTKVFGIELNNSLVAVGKWATGITAAAGTIGAMMLKVANDTAEYADIIDKTSERTGINREELQRWKFALEQSGGTLNSFVQGVKAMSTQLDLANNNSKESQRYFEQLGISFEELKSKTPEQAFEVIVKRLAEMENTTERTAIGTKILGRGFVDMLPLLNSGGEGIENLKNRADELGIVMSDISVRTAVAFKDEFAEIGYLSKSISNELGAAVIPIFRDLLKWFNDSLPAIRKWIDDTATALEFFGEVNRNIFEFVKKTAVNILEILNWQATGVENIMIGILQSVADKINGALNVIGGLIDKVNETFKTDFKKPTFEAFGENIVNGFRDGISKGNVLKNITQDIIASIQETETPITTSFRKTTGVFAEENKKQSKNAKETSKEIAKTKIEETTELVAIIDDFSQFLYDKTETEAEYEKEKAVEVKEAKIEESKSWVFETAEHLNKIAQATSDNADAIIQIEKDAIEQKKKDAKDYDEKYKEYYADMLQDVKEKKSEEEKVEKDAAEKKKKAYEELYDAIGTTFGSVYAEMTKNINKLLEDTEKSSEEMGKIINGILQGIASATKETSNELADFISATGAIIEATTLAIAGDYVGALTAIVKQFDAVKNTVINVWDFITGKTKESTEGMLSDTERAQANVLQEISLLGSQTTTNLEILLQTFGNTAQGTYKAIENTAIWLSAALENTMNNIFESGATTWEELKEAAKESYAQIEKVVSDLTERAISEANETGTALITALKNRHAEEEQLENDVFQKKIDTAEQYYNTMKAYYDEDLISRLASIDDEFRETLNLKNSQLTEEEKTLQTITQLRKDRKFEEEKEKLASVVLTATTEEEKRKAWEDYAFLLATRRKEEIVKELKDVTDAKSQKIQEAKSEYEEKTKSLKDFTQAEIDENKKLIEANKTKWEEIKKNTDYELEALLLMQKQNQDETIKMLETYNKKWQNAGQSFGEKLILGLNSTKTTMKTSIDEVISWVSAAQKSIEAVKLSQQQAQALIDSNSNLKFNEKSVITIPTEQNSSGVTGINSGVTQNITINSPTQLNAFEIARQTKNMTASILAG